LQVVLTSAEHSDEGSRRLLLTSAECNGHSEVSHNCCRIKWSFPAFLPKVSHNCCRIKWVIPSFVPRSLTTAVEYYGSFPPLARAHMPAANFSCFRLVGTVKDINGRFLLMKMKGLIGKCFQREDYVHLDKFYIKSL